MIANISYLTSLMYTQITISMKTPSRESARVLTNEKYLKNLIFLAWLGRRPAGARCPPQGSRPPAGILSATRYIGNIRKSLKMVLALVRDRFRK